VGRESLIRTVPGSGISIDSTVACAPARGLVFPGGGFLIHSNWTLTSSAVKSDPSWNLTPFFRVKRMLVGSGCSHFSARSGMMSCGVSPALSGSNWTSWFSAAADGQTPV
jgi:hypothetical protein